MVPCLGRQPFAPTTPEHGRWKRRKPVHRIADQAEMTATPDRGHDGEHLRERNASGHANGNPGKPCKRGVEQVCECVRFVRDCAATARRTTLGPINHALAKTIRAGVGAAVLRRRPRLRRGPAGNGWQGKMVSGCAGSHTPSMPQRLQQNSAETALSWLCPGPRHPDGHRGRPGDARRA